jgi:hypothetical protein
MALCQIDALEQFAFDMHHSSLLAKRGNPELLSATLDCRVATLLAMTNLVNCKVRQWFNAKDAKIFKSFGLICIAAL